MNQDPALVHLEGAAGDRGTHVVVIGIGQYDHLAGGGGPRFTSSIGQLSSPPEAARVVADWFIQSFRHPLKPLASLSVVISDAHGSRYTHPVSQETFDVPTGTGAEIAAAVRAWAERARAHPDNLAIFYFSGHGVDAGQTHSLLARDFGGSAADHEDGFVDANSIRAAMAVLGPGEQAFLFDACRVENPTLVDGQTSGRRPVTARPRPSAGTKPKQATMFAAVPGLSAYGRPGRESVFAAALLVGMETAASQRDDGGWWVGTGMLAKQIGSRVAKVQRGKLDGEEVVLCLLPGEPDVPVHVCCQPAESIHVSSLSCHSRDGAPQSVQGTGPFPDDAWETRLRSGRYVFQAEASPPGIYQTVRIQRFVMPPHHKVVMAIQVDGT